MLHVIPWCCKCSLDNACACLIPQMLTIHCMWYPYTESVNTILPMLTLCCRTNLIFEYEPGVANYLILQKVLSRCCKMTWYWVTWLLVKYADLLLNSRSLNYLCWSDSISDDRSQKFIIYPVAVFSDIISTYLSLYVCIYIMSDYLNMLFDSLACKWLFSDAAGLVLVRPLLNCRGRWIGFRVCRLRWLCTFVCL